MMRNCFKQSRFLLSVLLLACGPSSGDSDGGEDGDVGVIADVGGQASADWAVGRWFQEVSNGTDNEGEIIIQFEVRTDGRVLQERLTCLDGDILHDNPWELLADSTLRITPDGDEVLTPWMKAPLDYLHVELRPGEDCNSIVAVRFASVGSSQSSVTYQRGFKCKEFNEDVGQCYGEYYCGGDPPPDCE